MSETVVGVLQGIAAGIGILAASVGLLAALTSRGDVRVVLNDRVLTFNGPAHSAPADDSQLLPTPAAAEAAAEAIAVAATPPTVAVSAEPTPAPFTADLSYYNETAADLSLLVVSLKRLAILLESPQPEDEGWRGEMAAVTGAVRQAADNLSAVRPSDASIETHSFLMSATSRCARVALALDGDLTRLPVETFELVGDTLALCSADIASVLHSIN